MGSKHEFTQHPGPHTLAYAHPSRVTTAADAYFASQDTVDEFLAECLQTVPDFWEPPSCLFAAWRNFANARGMKPGVLSDFGDKMKAAGFRQLRGGKRGR
jgi:hypothetical protein